MRIDARHASVADGGEEHGHHCQQDHRDYVPARFLVENAEHRHRRRRLDQDDPVEDQVPESQGALQSDGFGLRGRGGRHSVPQRAATSAVGVSEIGATFQPSTWTTGVVFSPSGRCAVSVVDSPGVSSIQLSDQKTGAISPPDAVLTAARTWNANALE